MSPWWQRYLSSYNEWQHRECHRSMRVRKIEEIGRVEEDQMTQGDTRDTIEVEPLCLHVSQSANVGTVAAFVNLGA